MDLDQVPAAIELDQTLITARLELGARRAGRRRRRIQRVLDADVVIGVDGHVFPQRHVVGHAVVRQQLRPLFILEHDPGQLARGAVDALPGDVAAPHLGSLAAVGEVDEGRALPPALACVPNTVFHMRLILGRPHASWVQDQTARLAVLAKRARRSRVEGVGPSHRGGKIVHDQADREAPEESPRLLKPSIVASTVCWTNGQKKL